MNLSKQNKYLLYFQTFLIAIFCLFINPTNAQVRSETLEQQLSERGQEAAKEWATVIGPIVKNVFNENSRGRSKRLKGKMPTFSNIGSRYFYLESPIINNVEDKYLGVRFMHAKHAQQTNNCFTCHHARSDNLELSETARCSSCHRKSFDSAYPDRISLKAAYHRSCIGCHQKKSNGPVQCLGCHQVRTKAQTALSKSSSNRFYLEDVHIGAFDFQCAECHENPEGNATIPSCTGCHGVQPHIDKKSLSYHLNRHIKSIACITCHVPLRQSGVLAFNIDSESSAIVNNPNNDSRMLYAANNIGKQEIDKPLYLWSVEQKMLSENSHQQIEDIVNINDHNAKIYPVTELTGLTGIDLLNEKYRQVNHPVTSKESALSCSQCHQTLSKSPHCGRCHKTNDIMDFAALSDWYVQQRKEYFDERAVIGLAEQTNYLGFKKLGYNDDPVLSGGRFNLMPLGKGKTSSCKCHFPDF